MCVYRGEGGSWGEISILMRSNVFLLGTGDQKMMNLNDFDEKFHWFILNVDKSRVEHKTVVTQTYF